MSTPTLDPQQAKLAAHLLRKQQDEIDRMTKEATSLRDENVALKRKEECLKIAHQLSEIGKIPKDFNSIFGKAETLAASDRDLSVIKEAIDMTTGGFELGSVAADSKPGFRNALDAFTAAILEGSL